MERLENSQDIIKTISIHELFSKDSGIMEFVEWKNMDRHTAYIVMSDKTAEQKVEYFISNAIVP